MKKLVTIIFSAFIIISASANTTERAVLVFEGKRNKNIITQNLKRTKGIFETKSNRADAVILSKKISVPLSNPTPFIAFSASIEGDFDMSLLSFAISVSNDSRKWSEWQNLSNDTHSEKDEQRYFTPLTYLEKEVKYIKFRVYLKPNQLEGKKSFVRNIKLHFFSPGDDESFIDGNVQPQGNQGGSRSHCSCSLPYAVPRTDWGASLGLGTGISIPPASYTTVTHLVVHHEAGSNSSTNWAARVRSVWDLHVNTRGWQDIGYNYLVDPNGVLYVGRGGGDNVQGAHFTCNGGTMGVCLLGDYTSVSPTTNALNKLTEILAWKACQRDITPTATSYHSASGLQLANICGHKDNTPAPSCNTGTACPGNTFYPQLSTVRTAVDNYINNGCSGVNPCTAPPNDACAGTTLTVGTSCGSGTSGTVICATATNGLAKAACDGYSGTPHLKDVWYTFTASSTATYTITATPTSTSTATTNIDVVLALYTGSCGSLTPVANGCSDSGGGGGAAETITLSLTAGTYRVRVYDYGNGEPTTGSFSICVYSSCTPPTASISGTNTICSGESTTLTASGGGTYAWSNSLGSGASKTVSPTSTTTYTVTVTNNGCTATASRTVTVNSPSASISGTNSICTGESTTLTASGGGTYAWSNSLGSGASKTVSPTSTTTYTVTVTNNGCTATASRTVTVNTAPSASISGTNTICSGESTTLTASGGGTYAWSNSLGSGASKTVSPTSTTTYTVTVTTNGCTATANRTVTVNTSPSASISGTNSICVGESTTLTASGGGTYAWSNSLGSGASKTVSPTTTTTYTVTVTGSNGCTSTANRTVTVNQAPSASISGTNTICSGESTTLTASGGGTYAWSNSLGSGSSKTVSPTSNTTYTVTVTNNGCTATASRTVSVNQTPSVSVNPPSVSICSGGSGTTLQATGSAQNYSWSPSTGLNPTTGQTVTANPSSSITYTVTASNGNCSATATSAVTVSNQITASITPANPVICGSGSISLSATPGSAYAWSGPNNFNGNTQTVSVSNGGSYSVTVTNPGGCVGNATATITVTQNPALVIDAGTNQIIQSGDSAQLGGSPTASGGTSPYIYTWNPTTALDNAGAANPYANPTTGSTTYNLTVTDSKGCSATDNVSVTISTGCQTYVLDSLSMNIPFDSATYAINLTTGAGCPWSLTEGCGWLSFTNTAGSGTSALTFTVEENTLASPRTCYVNVQGNILIITQAQAAACLVPVSDFTASQQAIFAGNSVNFYDNSTNTPTQWEWTFTGGDISTSNTQNPTVTYSNGGLFDVTLKATNVCGNNTVTKTNYINVIGTVSIDNIAFDNSISIFPNPNNGTFRIVAQTSTQKAVQLKLFSAIGQLVYSEQMLPVANKIEKDVSVGSIAAGIYLLQITVNNKPSYKKLIIE